MDTLNQDEVKEKMQQMVSYLGGLVVRLTAKCYEHGEHVNFTTLNPSRDGDEPLALAVLHGEAAIADFRAWLAQRGQKTDGPIHTGMYLCKGRGGE